MTRVHLQGYVFGYCKKEELCSLLSFPMMLRDKALGVINSYTSVPHEFTGEEVKLLQAIANQAAIGIGHTTLIEKSHEGRTHWRFGGSWNGQGLPDALEEIDRRMAFKLIQQQSIDFRKLMREITEVVLLAGELDQRVEKHRGNKSRV